MIAKLKAIWGSIPHQIQAVIVGFATAFLVAFVHTLSMGNCFTIACFGKAFTQGIASAFTTLDGILTSLLAGGSAVATFYMKPNKPQ